MILLTSWISVLMAFLLSHFRKAKVYASGNSEEEIDFTYVIIGVTLGVFLAIGFVAVIICMIKNQMIDNVFGESDGKMDRRNIPFKLRQSVIFLNLEKIKQVKHGIKPEQRRHHSIRKTKYKRSIILLQSTVTWSEDQ